MLAEGVKIADAARSAGAAETGAWSLFEDHNPRNAIVAYTELEWE
jgi:hypothetical protein